MYYICNTPFLSTLKVIPPLPVDDVKTLKILKESDTSREITIRMNQVIRLLTNQNFLVKLIPTLESKSVLKLKIL